MRGVRRGASGRGAGRFHHLRWAKNLLTIAAEAQAKTGHDIQQFPGWEVQNHADQCEPVDDVMKRLTDKYGAVTAAASKYLFNVKGHWRAVPCSAGNQNKGPCGRISVLKEVAGLDVVKMYPPSADATPEAENWTYDAFLKAAEACKKANMTFGIGLGTTADSVDTAGSMFAAFGAELITAKGDLTVHSDNVRQVARICAATGEVPSGRMRSAMTMRRTTAR